MDWVSIVIVVVIGVLTWRAWVNGFIRELVALATAILAIPIAGVMYPRMFPKVNRIVTDGDLAALVSFLAILVAVVVGGQIIAHVLRRTASLLNLGVADRLVGGLFGFLKGFILAQVILLALVAFPSPDVRDPIDSSPVAKLLLDTSPVVLAFLPDRFDDSLDGFLNSVRSLAPSPSPAADRSEFQ